MIRGGRPFRRQPAASEFKRIAHRGASAECPENTLAAFRRAIELGASMIECDLQVTADDQVVVFHDWTLERTSDGDGVLAERTLAELRALDAGAWRDARFAGEKIPTLAELLETTAGRCELNLELKSKTLDPRLVRATVAEVERAGAGDRVLISSFHMELLEEVRRHSPSLEIAVLWGPPPFAEALAWTHDLDAVAFHPHESTVSPGLVEETQSRDLALNVWTVNSVERMVDLVRMGVEGVISDHPARLLEARAQLLGE